MPWVSQKGWLAWKVNRRLKVWLIVYCNEEINLLTGLSDKLQAMIINQQLKDKKNIASMKIWTMDMTWRITLLQQTQWNFIKMMSSSWTLYLEFHKWNWYVLGGYGKFEERSSNFMNNSWSDTTWVIDKIEPKVANNGLPRQLDICAILWRLLELQKLIWDYLSGYGNLRERSTSFMHKS